MKTCTVLAAIGVTLACWASVQRGIADEPSKGAVQDRSATRAAPPAEHSARTQPAAPQMADIRVLRKVGHDQAVRHLLPAAEPMKVVETPQDSSAAKPSQSVAGGVCQAGCDYCFCGTPDENNCDPMWFYDDACDCGCQFCDAWCWDCAMQDCLTSPCESWCDYCWINTEYENNCPAVWCNDGECDCGCQWVDQDCGGPPCGGGCPGSGDCCQANGTPGCASTTCCSAVCAVDPSCCTTEWDGSCAGLAASHCPELCGGGCNCHLYDDYLVYADACPDDGNTVDVLFCFLTDPGQVCFTHSPACGTLNNTCVSPQTGPAYCPYFAWAIYTPCEAECLTVTITADPTYGSNQTRTLCLFPRIDICVDEMDKTWVATYDAQTGCPSSAEVTASVLPSQCGSVDPPSCISQTDCYGPCDWCWFGGCDPGWECDGECDCGCQFTDACDCGCFPGERVEYTCGFEYTAGCCQETQVCMKLTIDNDPPYPDADFYVSYDQNDSPSCEPLCGNGICDLECEDCSTCPEDCGCGDCEACVGGVCQPCCDDGDIDTDGDVDLRDFAILQLCFGLTPPGAHGCESATLDCDDDVDLGDYKLLKVHLGGP